MDLDARSGDFFAKIAAQDIDGVIALCAPGFRLKQNNGPDNDVDTAAAGLRAMAEARLKIAYSDIRRTVADHVVTEQHVVTMTRPDGVSASSDVCVVIRFDDHGLVTRLDEYLDTVAFAPLSS